MKIRTRFIIAFGAVTAIVILLGAISYLIVGMQANSVAVWEEDTQDYRQTTLLVIGIAIVFAVLWSLMVGHFIAESITKPLEELREVADRISHGDLDVSVDYASDDEIGDLADSFSRMVASIKIARMGDAKVIEPQQEDPDQ